MVVSRIMLWVCIVGLYFFTTGAIPIPSYLKTQYDHPEEARRSHEKQRMDDIDQLLHLLNVKKINDDEKIKDEKTNSDYWEECYVIHGEKKCKDVDQLLHLLNVKKTIDTEEKTRW